jgi:chitinase
MTRHSLLRVAICNLLFLSIIFAACIEHNLNTRASYAFSQDLPSPYFAPDVDATIAGNPFPTVIAQAHKLAGTRYYELGFITTKVDQCQATWNGMNSLNYMQGDIANLRASGGDIILNFGGYAASNPKDPSVDPRQQEELALACPTVASLRAQYQKAITAYRATHIAFDIEGDALSNTQYASSVILRDQAITGLQSGVPGTKLCVEFTLTGTTTGLTDKGEVLLKDAIDKGINICLVNILAMNYGSSAPVDQPGIMGQYAVNAAKEAFIQLKYLFPKKSDSQVWSMMGLTIMNGVNNSSGQGGREIFAVSDIPTVLQFAMKSGIRELSMWELHRDQPPPAGNIIAPTDTVTATPSTNSGIQQKPYQFSVAFNKFSTSASSSSTSGPNPIISGQSCSNVAITGQSVEALAEGGGSQLIAKMSELVAAKPKHVIPTKLPTTGGHLGLLISKNGYQFQVGQQVTYQLTPCNVSLTGTQMIVLSDTISGGLTNLRVANKNWQIISNPTLPNSSMEIIAIYTGPPRTTAGGTLPPLVFSGTLTTAAFPSVSSFVVVATLAGTSGSLRPSQPSRPLGPIAVSLNANITGWAAAVDTLPVLSPKKR